MMNSSVRNSSTSYSCKNKLQIGGTKVFPTRLGIGGGPFGGSLGAGFEDASGLAAVDSALNAGIGYFDVAPFYGYGRAEKLLGKALDGVPRDTFVLSTKVGRTLVHEDIYTGTDAKCFDSPEPFRAIYDFSADAAAKQIEGSLERLRLSRIDIAYIHDPDEGVTYNDETADPFSRSHFDEVMGVGGVYRYLRSLKDQGVIGAIGVGINQWQMAKRFVEAADFDCILLAGCLTLLQHQGAVGELLPLCQKNQVSLVIGGVFHTGILATGTELNANPTLSYQGVAPNAEILTRVRQMEAVCKRYGVPLGAAAIQFPFRFSPTASVLVGVQSEKEVQADIAWMSHQIPEAFWKTMQSEGLIY